MKFICIGIIMIALFSNCVFSADILNRIKAEERSKLLIESGHYFSGGPDSEEKMVVAQIIKRKSNAGHANKFRADSPYPERVRVLGFGLRAHEQDKAPLLSKSSGS